MIDREIAAIAGENLEQLRARWNGRWGNPPRLRSVALLRRLIAWRLQAEAHGGIDDATRRMLRGAAPGPEKLMAPGTVLTREWQGVRHQVEITEDGLIHAGRHWKSLSEVARAITGTRWNGPRFFGLRETA
jgi:hypothetical protein